MTNVQITINSELLMKALQEAPRQLLKNMPVAGMEALKIVLDTTGIRAYPPETEANFPPTPYYIRNTGTQYTSYNDQSSETYGKRWDVSASGYTAKAENTASYAPYLVGEQQAAHMARIGWRKLGDVAREKMQRLGAVYEKWVAYSLREAGL